MKNLNHSGILKVYDMIDTETNPTIIMEYFEGENLKEIGIQSLISIYFLFVYRK